MSRQLLLVALVFIAIATEVVALRASGPSLSPGRAPSSPSNDYPSQSSESPSKSQSLRSILIPPESSPSEQNGSPASSPQVSSEYSPERSPASSPDSFGDNNTTDGAEPSVFSPSDGTNDDYADYN